MFLLFCSLSVLYHFSFKIRLSLLLLLQHVNSFACNDYYHCNLCIYFIWLSLDRSVCNNTHHLWSYASHQLEKELKAFNVICIILTYSSNNKSVIGKCYVVENDIDLFSINFWLDALLNSAQLFLFENRAYG